MLIDNQQRSGQIKCSDFHIIKYFLVIKNKNGTFFLCADMEQLPRYTVK